MAKILVVDDHPVVLNGTKDILEQLDNVRVDIQSNPRLVIKSVQMEQYDVCILDVNMKEIDGVTLAKNIRKIKPTIKIVLYTGYNLYDFYELLLNNEIDGLLSKESTKEKILHTISAVLRSESILPLDFIEYVRKEASIAVNSGHNQLSTQQLRILEYVSEGYTNKAISFELKVTQRTVENHLTRIFTILNVGSRLEAVLKAKELKLIK